jgi:spore maturation protein SpmA
MWSKTLVGFVVSLLLSLSLMLNVAYLIPLHREVYLLLGFVGGILLWAGMMTVFYCVERVGKVMRVCGPLLVGSVAVNALFVAGVVK